MIGFLLPRSFGGGEKGEDRLNSRDKGRRGELELAHYLQGYGYDTRRGQQFSGANGDADVVGLPGLHIECKRVEKTAINDWLEQAVADASIESVIEDKTILPAVFHRQNHSAKKAVKGMWKVTMLADDFMVLYKNWRGG